MDPKSILEAAAWIAGAGAACATVVQLVKIALASTLEGEARLKVVTAAAAGAVLTGLFALSTQSVTAANAYQLVLAWITITATGAGLQSAITATVTNRPT